MGRADYYAPGDYNALCSCCGFKFKASELSKNWQGMYRCYKCQEPRQPQDFVKAVPDVQAPPWVQPWTQQSNGTAYLNVDDSYTSLDLSSLFNDEFPNGVSGATTVIITIAASVLPDGAMLVIDSLTTGTGWPAGVTTLKLNVFGYVLAYNDNSGLIVDEDTYPGGHMPSAGVGYVLTAGFINIGGADEYGLLSGLIGSITPTTYLGNTIAVLVTGYVPAANPGTVFTLIGSFSQNHFTSLTLNGFTLLTSTATFSSGNQWFWSDLVLSVIGDYLVTIT